MQSVRTREEKKPVAKTNSNISTLFVIAFVIMLFLTSFSMSRVPPKSSQKNGLNNVGINS